MPTINILQFITPTGFYGAERWILALNSNLDPKRVRTDLVVTTEAGKQPEIIRHYSSEEGRVFEIEMSSRFSVSAVSGLIELIKQRDIDIIHTHGYKSDILGLIAARISGIKAISTPHGFGEPNDLKLKIFIRLGKFVMRYFDSIVPLSEQLVKEVTAAGVPESRVRFIRNAVDLKEVERIQQMADSDNKIKNKRRIGFIGQMIPRKKVDHILSIFNQLWLDNNDIELYLLGDGISRDNMEEYARTLPSCEDIKFFGFRDDRLEMLSEFDLFVMTSSDEGIPRCLMEAIAMGVPVSAYKIQGVDQLVEHEQTGLLADYGDQDTLKTYWRRLLSDRDYAASLAEAGKEFVKKMYSGQRLADEYTVLYKELLSDEWTRK